MRIQNIAEFAQLASRTLGMVLVVTADPMSGSLNFTKLNALGDEAVEKLRYDGVVVLTADSSDLAERDRLRSIMSSLDFELEDDSSLHAEAILFDKGDLMGRQQSIGVTPSDF